MYTEFIYPEYTFDEKIKVTSLISSFETDYKSDFYFKGEYHDFWEMVYVVSGQAGVSADGTAYELSAGELIIHKPMEFHKLWAVGEGNMRVFVVAFNAQGEVLPRLENFVAKLDYLQQEVIEKMLLWLKKGGVSTPNSYGQINYLESWEQNKIQKQMIKNYIEILLLSIGEGKVETKKHSDMHSAEIYMKIVRVMEDNVYDWISVDEIASKCSFSSSYIKKVFKKYASCGIHEYFIKLKIKKAVSLMENGCSVCQASEKLSFANENYFGVVFKRETGVSPGKYVKR